MPISQLLQLDLLRHVLLLLYPVNGVDIFNTLYSPDDNYIVYGYKNIIKSSSNVSIENYSVITGCPTVYYSSADGEFKIETIFASKFNIDMYRNEDKMNALQKTQYYIGYRSSIDNDYNLNKTMTIMAYPGFSFNLPGATNNILKYSGCKKKSALSDYGISTTDFSGWYYDVDCTKPIEWNNDEPFVGTCSVPRFWKIKDSNGNWTEVECQPGATYTLYAGWNFS